MPRCRRCSWRPVSPCAPSGRPPSSLTPFPLSMLVDELFSSLPPPSILKEERTALASLISHHFSKMEQVKWPLTFSIFIDVFSSRLLPPFFLPLFPFLVRLFPLPPSRITRVQYPSIYWKVSTPDRPTERPFLGVGMVKRKSTKFQLGTRIPLNRVTQLRN